MIDEKKLVKEICNTACKVYEFETDELLDAFMLGLNAKQICVMDLIAKQPKVGEWIPVEKGLPEHNHAYPYYEINLVTIENGNVCLGVYRSDDKEWLTRMSEGETVYSNKHKVIAWMPLPEPYRKEDK